MTERPILFNGPMVRAVLEGRKTQTRRVVKPRKSAEGLLIDPGKLEVFASEHLESLEIQGFEHIESIDGRHRIAPPCPYGQPGDRLWVRETTEEDMIGSASLARYSAGGGMVCSESGGYHEWWYSRRVCPSIHMPRWASRITLEVTGRRLEQLQDISEADAKAEGAEPKLCTGYPYQNPPSTYVNRFCHLWKSINGPGSWDANPWVWVVDFRRIT